LEEGEDMRWGYRVLANLEIFIIKRGLILEVGEVANPRQG